MSDFDKISSTAFMVSLARRLTDIPYARELAHFAEVQRLARLPLILESRYKAINQVIAQHPFKQYLELASGLLPRGMVMTADPAVTFIESDLPEMIQTKQEIVRTLLSSRDNLHFLEIDATAQPNQLLQCADFFRPDLPVLVLCEGLLMYLTQEEKARACANIRQVLRRFGGMWVTSDFASATGIRQSIQHNPDLQRRIQSLATITGRSLADNAFDSLDQARQFAVAQGFQVAEYSMLHVLEEMSCLKVLGMDTETAQRILSHQAVFILTPNEAM